jgi:flagellin-like protein
MMARLRYRRRRSAVSPVIGTVLMVAVTVILATITYIIVNPLVNPEEEPPVDLIFLQQEEVTQTDATHWDTYFTVSAIESDDEFPWTTVSFVVQGSTGSLVTDATITYGDSNLDGELSEGDSIILTGMTADYSGATLKVLHRGSMIGQIPISFIA